MLGMTLKSGTRRNHNFEPWHRAPWNQPWNLGTSGPLEPIEYDHFLVHRPKVSPVERYWPYVEKPEEPTAEELAALDPDLHTTLFGPRDLPFSITLVFPPFDGENYERAVVKARASAEYLEIGEGADRRHRARFFRATRCGCAICSSSSGRCPAPKC